VSEDGAASKAADALTEGGAADTAAKGAHEIAAAPRNVAASAADAARDVSGNAGDAAKGVSGNIAGGSDEDDARA
jgi:hypothetical protein